MQNALKARGKTNEEVKGWMQIDSKDRRARKLCQKYGPISFCIVLNMQFAFITIDFSLCS